MGSLVGMVFAIGTVSTAEFSEYWIFKTLVIHHINLLIMGLRTRILKFQFLGVEVFRTQYLTSKGFSGILFKWYSEKITNFCEAFNLYIILAKTLSLKLM